MFAVQQTKSASGQQQRAVAGESVAPSSGAAAPSAASSDHRSRARKAIDGAADAFASPFDGIASGVDSEWLSHGVKLLFSLLLYGFGLSYLARTVHVRSSSTVGPRSAGPGPAGPPATAPR